MHLKRLLLAFHRGDTIPSKQPDEWQWALKESIEILSMRDSADGEFGNHCAGRWLASKSHDERKVIRMNALRSLKQQTKEY